MISAFHRLFYWRLARDQCVETQTAITLQHCMHLLLGWAACKCMISVDQKPGAQERYCGLGAATAAAMTSPACWSPGRQSAKLCEGKNGDYSVSGPAETGHWAAASKVSAGYLWVAALGAAAQGRGGGLVRPGGVDGCLDTP